jgi:hypothetical protein
MSERNPSYHPHRHLEPFGEPRTMAVQWDLSNLVSPIVPPAKAASFGNEDTNPAEGDSPINQPGESAWEKFPQPATIPAGWDLSELLKRDL